MERSYRLKQEWLCSPIRPGVIADSKPKCFTKTTIIRLFRITQEGGTRCSGTISVIVVPLHIVMSWDGSRWMSSLGPKNDHAWPWGNRKAYNHRTGRYDEEVIQTRRELLMEGYWYTLNCRPVKRRLMIVAQMACPTDMPRILELEDNNIFTAERMIECGGFIRPVAIRATSGHSFAFRRPQVPIGCQC